MRIEFLPGDWRLAVALDLKEPKVTATLEFSMGILGWKGWSHKTEGSEQSMFFTATKYEEYLAQIPTLMKKVIDHNYKYLETRDANGWRLGK